MDATFAKGKTAEDLRRHYGAVLGVAEDMPVQIMPQDHAFAILDAAGADLVLNFMSMGWTATEIASHFKVPSMAYAKWIAKRLPADDVAIATKNFADALVTRAMYVLSHRHSSPQEQSSMKQFAKMARDLAACASPDQWMPSRIAGSNPDALSAVTLNIDIGTGLAQTTVSSTTRQVAPPTFPSSAPENFTAPAGAGLLPNDIMPPPAPQTSAPPPLQPGEVPMGWIFGDTSPQIETAGANPPTRERPNG